MFSSDGIAQHYGSAGLPDRILAALKLAGKNQNSLTVEDLAPLDQFHTRGLAATRELIAFAGVKPGWRVLDVGSGLGGPARVLASERNCHVTGVDITTEFCEVATMLSKLTRLERATDFRHGDATALPLEDGQFDLVWTMQIQMSIENKRRFYGEIFRVLKPEGRFVFQDIMGGPGGEVHLPVPWTTSRESSFLISIDSLRETLKAVGFQIETLEDFSEEALAWRKKQPAAAGLAPATLGMHVVMGEQYGLMQSNMVRNLEQQRVTFVRGAASKPQIAEHVA
jgi:ubiquinone/menaquinone biosynthesis C-methylase UbiE